MLSVSIIIFQQQERIQLLWTRCRHSIKREGVHVQTERVPSLAFKHSTALEYLQASLVSLFMIVWLYVPPSHEVGKHYRERAHGQMHRSAHCPATSSQRHTQADTASR